MKQPCFMLTGFEKTERLELVNIIKQMNGLYIYDPADQQAFLPGCTHMIAKKPCKSLKFLSAVASGKWILRQEFLRKSFQSKSWLNEQDYEWKDKDSTPDDMVELFQAPRRWRIKISTQNQRPPFCGWRVGLEVPKKYFSTYKRLLEIGGGSATQVQNSSSESYTHILVHPKLAKNVRRFHDRGIPCLTYDYLAQYLLKEPPPTVAECCVFTSATSAPLSVPNLSVDTKCFVKLSKCDDLLSPNSYNSLVSGSRSQQRVFKSAESSEEEQESVFPQKNEEHSSPDRDIYPSQDIVTPLRRPVLEIKRLEESSSGGEGELPVRVIPVDPDSSSDSERSIDSPNSPSDKEEGMTSYMKVMSSDTTPNLFEKLCAGGTAPTVVGSNPVQAGSSSAIRQLFPDASRAQPSGSKPENLTDDALLTNRDVITKPSRLRKIAIPLALKAKHEEIKQFLKSLSLSIDKKASQDNDVIIDCDAIDDEEVASRFGKMEMSMVERFAEAEHTRSVIFICNKLLSAESYPPPDLIYLLMKKYILDSHNFSESFQALAFLHSTLLIHPPSAPHMRHDDIYLKALGKTFSTDSSLLSATKLNLHGSKFIWNQPREESHEWSFVSTTIKQAMTCSEPKRRKAAVSLLSYLANVLEQDNRLLRHMLWPRSRTIRQSTALRSLLKLYREVIDIVAPTSSSESYTQAEDDDIIVEDIPNVDFGDKTQDDVGSGDDVTIEDPGTLFMETCFSLGKVVNAIFEIVLQENSESVDVITQCMSESFREADGLTLGWLFRELRPSISVRVARAMLCQMCKEDWSPCAHKGTLSLHRIVDEFMISVPKPPKLIAKEWTPSKKNSVTSMQLAPQLSDQNSSDKENFQVDQRSPPPSTSPGYHVTSASVNKRNPKGETALHRACILNQPSRVAQLLTVVGVDPNSRDHAGWTPLSEACNHGHLECVKELLRLPLSTRSVATSSGVSITDIEESGRIPALEIDLLACPEEGTTPLHDALSNAHIEVARLLLEKGGIELLYVVDKQGTTPLDVCMNDDVRSLVLEIACHIAANNCGSPDPKAPSSPQPPRADAADQKMLLLPADEEYMKVLPPTSLMATDAWQQTCSTWLALLRHFIIAYVNETGLNNVMAHVEEISHESGHSGDDFSSKDVFMTSHGRYSDVTNDDVTHVLSDLACVVNWSEIEKFFLQHVSKVLGKDDFTLNADYLVFSKEKLERFQITAMT